MQMLGTIVNAVAIIIGGILGSVIKSHLKEKYKEAVMNAIGISVIFVGASGAIQGMLRADAEPALFIVSLVIGTAVGTFIGIDRRLNAFGEFVQKKFASNDKSFAKSFTYTSILFCVGTMAILGSIQSGTENKHSILFAKSALDGVTALIFASTGGIGAAFSAISVLIYQGILTVLSGFLGENITADMLREISIVGGIVITCIGVDILGIKKMKIADFLPAIFIPVIYYLVYGTY